ncbi:MAG: hypothetical protein HKO57_14785 [Akkermansiaceae bacterium]|nr:hypothetical protein [Akkermansiaceae bacterium]
MYMLIFVRPEAAAIFHFDWEKILGGEIWRCATFIFLPPIPFGSILGALFMFFMLMISFLMSDSLESVWGTLRTSLYCYGLFICQLAANIMIALLGFLDPVWWGGILFYEAIFFAFATHFPRYEFRLMLIFPVPVFILAIVTAALGVLMVFPHWPSMLYGLICFLPYLAWAVPRLVMWSKTRSDTVARQTAFRAKSTPAGEAFHHCEECGATELSHPDRYFRVTAAGDEICSECLPDAAKTGPAAKTSREP